MRIAYQKGKRFIIWEVQMMKYKVGQLVRIIDDVSPPIVYYIGLIVGVQPTDTYDILCVGDKESDVFFESEIVGVVQ